MAIRAASDTVAGHRLLRLLGSGAESEVYLAVAPGDRELVALKLTPLAAEPSAHEAFRAAAQVAAQLVHPGLVRVWSWGIEGRTGWLAMEPVPGTDLLRYTRPPRLLPEAVALGIAARVADALAHAHRHGVVHRDIKPANVLVDWAAGIVKLVDLGLARSAATARTGTGIVPGTPNYMAPEVLAGVAASPAGDLYALGAMLFELLVGEPPFSDASLGRFLQRVSQEPAPALRSRRPELPAALETLLAALLAKAPAQRPPSAAAVAETLRAIGHTLPGSGGPMSRPVI